MRSGFRGGNRPLEWDSRNGVIQRYGAQAGIATPISDVIVPLLAAASEGPG
ncbi:hypothetical protein ACP6OU_001054 [Cronobacter muytjensii]